MTKNMIILVLSILFTSSCIAQLKLQTDLKGFSLNFVKSIAKDTKISELEKNFDSSIRSDSLRKGLEAFKTFVLKYQDRAEHYMIKVNRPLPQIVYNINFHDPKKKEQFGDLRLMFKDDDDYLIDGWVYFDATDMENIEIIEIVEDDDEDFITPVPKPPPGPK